MNDLDYELRKALCRREPPPGFADRVMARLPARPGSAGAWRLFAAAAAILIVLAGVSLWRLNMERERRVAAEKAKAELIYALKVTSEGLETAKAILHRRQGGKRI